MCQQRVKKRKRQRQKWRRKNKDTIKTQTKIYLIKLHSLSDYFPYNPSHHDQLLHCPNIIAYLAATSLIDQIIIHNLAFSLPCCSAPRRIQMISSTISSHYNVDRHRNMPLW
jgi:hypothetical protein